MLSTTASSDTGAACLGSSAMVAAHTELQPQSVAWGNEERGDDMGSLQTLDPLQSQARKATLNKSQRMRAPDIGMGCKAQNADGPDGPARLCNAADRPMSGCTRRDGLVQRCPKMAP
jgi:hypothetical protein